MNQTMSASLATEAEIPAFRVRHLDFYYGKKQALAGVNLDLYPRKVTAMIGSSGCGKSTLLKTLNRIGELEGTVSIRGKVEFFGNDIYKKNVNLNLLRRQIGMVFQRPNPFPTSIYNNVAYGIRIFRSVSRSELDGIVETALRGAALWDEVKDSLKKNALGLSGGQQQRLCIARALAVQPRVLLMDEPCSALDPISTLQVEDLIRTLRDQLTIVVVTHNMQQAARVSDFTAFFNVDEGGMGRLVEFGKTDRLFSQAQEQETRDYVSGRFG